MILLDTNVISDMAREPAGVLAARVLEQPPNERATSVVVAAELEYGLARRPQARTLAHNVRGILTALSVLPLPVEAAQHYGPLRAWLESSGRSIHGMDLLIAAHASVLRATVITRNLRHFTDLPGVRAEDWSPQD